MTAAEFNAVLLVSTLAQPLASGHDEFASSGYFILIVAIVFEQLSMWANASLRVSPGKPPKGSPSSQRHKYACIVDTHDETQGGWSRRGAEAAIWVQIWRLRAFLILRQFLRQGAEPVRDLSSRLLGPCDHATRERDIVVSVLLRAQ